MTLELISYHGGHSGQFCCHAKDRLEDVIKKYIDLGFKRVGITEHAPPSSDLFLYPDEKKRGFSAIDLLERFESYFSELERLKSKYEDVITIYAGMETETVTGFKPHMRGLIEKFKPDYIVGSVHHVDDICFDFSAEKYQKAVDLSGGIEPLYLKYFDLQYDMIKALKPFVVGHFDLIRIFDSDYTSTLLLPAVNEKIKRNLELIKSLGLVMDFNLRPLTRGEKEPYISESILTKVKAMEILPVPGDDSHGARQAGNFIKDAIGILSAQGFNTNWPEPRLLPVPEP